MRPRITSLVAIVLAAAMTIDAIAPTARAEDLDPQAVKKAIDGGVTFLKHGQRNGLWPDYAGHPYGVTGLCTLALLNCGVPTDDPAVAAALRKLRQLSPDDLGSVYSVSLHAMVLCQADPQKHLLQIGRDVDWLEKVQIKSGRNKGCWNYPMSGNGDNSNAQFAVLALYEAERVGVSVNRRTWELAYDYWKRAQNDDGSWGYVNGSVSDEAGDGKRGQYAPGSGSMTCAGIAAIIMCRGRLAEADAQVNGEQVACCGRQADDPDDPVVKGMAWLGRNFAVAGNPTGGGQRDLSRHLYYLYALERVGRLTNERWIGDNHDWYREGTHLLAQGAKRPAAFTGHWEGAERSLGENDKNVATSFALLFLSKGQRPVLIAELQHGDDDDWNQHRHDIANLTEHVETRWRKLQSDLNLTWQIMRSEKSTLEDLQQTPVLFIGGKKPLDFDAGLIKRLRAYVDQGGFIFAENTCGGAQFDESFQAMLAEMFPGMSLEPLDDPTHPIWNADEVLKPEFLPRHPLYGLNAGCRLGVVYCPRPLSGYWELAKAGRDVKYPKHVQAEIDFCLGLGANVLAYATNRKVKFKFENYNHPTATATANTARGSVSIAKLRHAGGCNDAPHALERLAELAGEHLKMDIRAEKELVDLDDPRLFEYHLMFMHGKRDFSFSAEQRKRLKQYVENGGMLMVDALSSSPEFGKAFRIEMSKIFPDHPLEAIDPAHPMITPDAANRFEAFDISHVTFREPVAGGANERRTVKTSQIPPRLEGIKLDNRYGVIFSPYDLSCALESFESLQFPGYAREDAAKIAMNIVLYSLRQ
ncbi:MAG: DUF4159 domain-containing protein [Pirellulales bacterium]